MSIEGQGHFFTIYFPGFVCFVLYWAKISGERLQDHWSSGLFIYLLFIYLFIFISSICYFVYLILVKHFTYRGYQNTFQIYIDFNTFEDVI